MWGGGGLGREYAEGSGAFWHSVMEMSTESQDTCALDLALSPSGCDTMDQPLVSLDPVLAFLLMSWMSTQKGCSAELQVAQNCEGEAIIPKTAEVRLKMITNWA